MRKAHTNITARYIHLEKTAIIYAVDYEKIISDINNSWLVQRASLSKDDLAFIGNKSTLHGKMLGFLTSSYYKRNNLIKQSEVFYAYVFKEWSNEFGGNDKQHPTWMLFSPSASFKEHPEKLKKVAEALQGLTKEKLDSAEEKHLFNLINEPLSDCSYFEIPQNISYGDLVYLSIVYVMPDLVQPFHLGLNLMLANQSVSKEVLYFPTRYWPEEFAKVYELGVPLQ
jgi:hypothetical protein